MVGCEVAGHPSQPGALLDSSGRGKGIGVAQITSFINYKGGVGKTTIAVETAATLAMRHGFKVLVVDLDPQTNATFYLVTEETWEDWADSSGSLKDIFNMAIREEHFDVGDVIMEDLYGCIDLLPSHLDLLPVDLDLAAKWGSAVL